MTDPAQDPLRDALKGLYVGLLRDRERCAKSTTPGSAEKAVAYQSAAGRLLVILDAHPATPAVYVHPPHDDLHGTRSRRYMDGGVTS